MNRQLRASPISTPSGTIDTLSSGLALMARHAWLLILPIVFDLFLWLAPPLTIGMPLHQALFPPVNMATLLVGAPDADVIAQAQSIYDNLSQQVVTTNYWYWFRTPGLFFPTMMAGSPVAPTDAFWTLNSPLAFISAFVALTLLGLFVNVGWLHAVAFAATRNAAMLSVAAIFRTFGRLVTLGILLFLILCGVFFLTLFFLAVLTLLLPGVGATLATFILLAELWLAIWIGVQLYFTIAALVVGQKGVIAAPGSSLDLLRRHPDNPHWRSGYAFIMLSLVLSWGFALIWQGLMSHPVGQFLSIVGNAALGTGIAAAMMLFYHQRTNRQIETNQEQPASL